jgi:hypothetical protein
VRVRPTVPLVLAVAGAATLLTACSASSGSPTSAATASAPATSPVASSASSSSFAVLPESVLADMKPLVYTTPAGADAGMVAQGAKPAVSSVFAGGISRELSYQGKAVGGVELYRFLPAVAADARAKFVPLMVQSFAQVTPVPTKLGSTAVEVADAARGTTITAVGWAQGDDVVLVWAQGVSATQQIAQQYIAQSK